MTKYNATDASIAKIDAARQRRDAERENETVLMCERTVLGAILADNSQMRLVQLQQRDFSVTSHAQVFELAKRLIGAGKCVDAVCIADHLDREYGRSGWIELTVGMHRDCLAPENAPAYAERIRVASLSRQAAAIGQRLQIGGHEEIADAIRDLIELTSADKEHACHVSTALANAADELQRLADGQMPGVCTGIHDLDDALGGLHSEDLVVIAARPAMGKTALMLNIGAAANCGVGVVSGEQGRMQVGMRLFAMEGPVSLHRMRLGKLDDEEWNRITSVMTAMRDRPFWIYDKPAPTIDDIVAQARRWKFHNNIGLLMVDYLQKIRGGRGPDFRLQIGDIAAQLKDLARELKIPVVALAQVKREVESRPMGEDGMGRCPGMSDIAEAAIIEQEADQILTAYRPEVYEPGPRFKGLAFLNICKNRHGPIGVKDLSWRGEYLKFGDLARNEIGFADRWSAP